MARTVRTPPGKPRNKHLSQQPYSEDRNKGRRTGQNIKEVERDDDGFEDFAELAEANEPPAKRKKSMPRSHRTPNGLSRDEGPRDLFTEDASEPTPSKYVAGISRPAPSSVGHVGSLSRRIERSRMTDFDSIPSPVAASGPSRLPRLPSIVSELRAGVGTSRPKPVPRYGTAQPSTSRDVDYEDSPPRRSRVDNRTGAVFYQDEGFHPSQSLPLGSSNDKSIAGAVEPESGSESDYGGAAQSLPSSPMMTSNKSNSHARNQKDSIRKRSLTPTQIDNPISGDERDEQGRTAPSNARGKGKSRAISEEPLSDNVRQDDYDAPMDDYTNEHQDDGASQPDDQPVEAEDENEEDLLPSRKLSKAKAKTSEKTRPKALTPVDEEDEDNASIEDDIEAGLTAIRDSDEDGEPATNPDKVARKATKRKKAASPTKQKANIVKVHGRSATTESEGNVRRSTRTRIRPLEYWRGERIILGRAEDGPAPCPVLKAFVTIPKEIPKPLGGSRKRKRGGSSKKQNRLPPETGWDENTAPMGFTAKWGTQEEEERRIAFTAAMMEPEAANSTNTFSYQKIFSDDDFIAAGVLALPVGGEKPMKGTKDNTYVFFCHVGAVSVTVHKQSFIIAPGGTFLVPRGNQYYIQNISKRETILFFSQARKVPLIDDDDYDEASAPPSSVSRHRAPSRSSLAHGSSVTPKPSRQPAVSPSKGKASKLAARAGR